MKRSLAKISLHSVKFSTENVPIRFSVVAVSSRLCFNYNRVQ